MQSRAARGAGVRGRRVAVRRAVSAIEALESRRLMSVTNLYDGVTASQAGGFQPADPYGAVGPGHLVNVVNSHVQWFTKSGVLQRDESLNQFFATVPGVSSTSFIFDPKVTYDQYNNRFVMVALWIKDFSITGDPSSESHALMAVSDDADPNGTWYFQDINTKQTIEGTDAWLDYPGLAVSQDAIYLTGNMFSFSLLSEDQVPVPDAEGGVLGTRLFIIPKGPLYAGGKSFVPPAYDPVGQLGLTAGVWQPGQKLLMTLQPAHMYGTTPTGLGTFLTLDAGDDENGHDRLYVIRVDNPLGIPVFTSTTLDVGDISTRRFHGAPQPVPPVSGIMAQFYKFTLGNGQNYATVDTNFPSVLSAVWRNGQLYATQEVVPPSGPDAGQVTAHWYQIATGTTSSVSTPFLVDQGNVGGEDIGVGVNTFFPSIAVNANGDIAIGFSASGPISITNNQGTTPATATPVYPSAYVTTRIAGRDPVGVGFTRPSQLLAAGQGFFLDRNQVGFFGASTNRWGDYSSVQVDPSDDTSFWAYNMYALQGTTDVGGVLVGSEWGTRWGKFTAELLDLPAIGSHVWNDLNGNGIRDLGEPGLQGVIFRLYDALGNLIDQTVSDGAGRWYLQAPPAGSMTPGSYRIVADISAVDSLGKSILQGFTFSPEDQAGGTSLLIDDSQLDSDFLSPSNPLAPSPSTLALNAFQRSTALFTIAAGQFYEYADLGLFKPFVAISTSTPTVVEGGPGAVHQAQFTLTLYTGVLPTTGTRTPTISPWNTQVYLSTIAVSATSDVDYQSHTLDLVTIPAGQSTTNPGDVQVAVLGDTTAEGAETFQVVILQPSEVFGWWNDNLPPGQPPFTLPLPDLSQILNAADKSVVVTIQDDDLAVVTVDPGPTVVEGAPGNVSYALFTIRLSVPNPLSTPVRVRYTLQNGTDTANNRAAIGGAPGTLGADFDNTGSGTIVEFAPGQLTKTIRVPIFGDSVREPNQTFTLTVAPVNPDVDLKAGAKDQLTATATIVDLNMQSISFSAKKSATYRDIAGNVVTITLTGPGKGTVTKSSTGIGQILNVTGSTEKSVLTIRTSGGQTTFTGISITGGLASLNAPTTNVNGSLTSIAAIRNLTVNYVSGGQVVLGPSGDPNVFVNVKINRVVDSSFDSGTAINTFLLGSWIDTGTPDQLVAPAIKQLRATGDFGADVTTNIGDLGTMTVGGVLKGSSVTVTPSDSPGKIGTLTVGSMLNSQVTAGQRIGSVVVRNLFSNSTITAPRIDRLELGRIQNTTGDVLVAAEANHIGSVRWTFNGKTRTIKNVDNPGPRGLDKDVDNNPQIILQID